MKKKRSTNRGPVRKPSNLKSKKKAVKSKPVKKKKVKAAKRVKKSKEVLEPVTVASPLSSVEESHVIPEQGEFDNDLEESIDTVSDISDDENDEDDDSGYF